MYNKASIDLGPPRQEWSMVKKGIQARRPVCPSFGSIIYLRVKLRWKKCLTSVSSSVKWDGGGDNIYI
jgi:hypothetical protein